MKRIWKTTSILAVTAVALFGLRKMATAQPVALDPVYEPYQGDAATKVVTGRVVSGDAPVSGAVVYMKNMKTLAVKSFISGQDGSFRFSGLSPNADYEVYAELNGARSDTKSVSSFDSRRNVTVTLKLSK